MSPRRALNSTACSPPKRQIKLIMDSGAYSAWRLGKPIDLKQYCDFLERNLDWIEHPVALDVINPKDPEAAAAASFENLKYMRSRGLNPVPVYHVGEDVKWLFKMLDLGCDYIGLSASSLVSRNKVNDWYAMAWSHLVDSQGRATVRAHAFGEGRYDSLRRFPWYSADSTSWIYAAQRTGTMVFADGRKVSHRNDGLNQPNAQDLESLPEYDTKELMEVLREAGISREAFSVRGSVESTVLRTYVTLLYYKRVQERVRALQPISYRQDGFLTQGGRDAPAREDTPFEMYLVIGGNPAASSVLAHAGYPHALVSYFYVLANKHYERLNRFVYGPRALCSNEAPYKRAFDILEKYIHVPAAA